MKKFIIKDTVVTFDLKSLKHNVKGWFK